MAHGKPSQDWSDNIGRPKRSFAQKQADKRARKKERETIRDRFKKIEKDEKKDRAVDDAEVARIEAEMAAFNPNSKESRKERRESRRQAKKDKRDYAKKLAERLAKPSDGRGMVAEFVEPEKAEAPSTQAVVAENTPKDPADGIVLGSALDVPGGITIEDEITLGSGLAHMTIEDEDAVVDRGIAELEALYGGEDDSAEEGDGNASTEEGPRMGPEIGRPD